MTSLQQEVESVKELNQSQGKSYVSSQMRQLWMCLPLSYMYTVIQKTCVGTHYIMSAGYMVLLYKADCCSFFSISGLLKKTYIGFFVCLKMVTDKRSVKGAQPSR